MGIHLKSNEWTGLAALVLSVFVFDLWERRRPARPLDRTVDLKLNLLAFAATLGFKHLFDGNLDPLVARITGGWSEAWLASVDRWPSAAKILAGLVLMDFTLYWIHREQHRIPWLWRSHVWHHTIEQLYWLSMFRVSWFHLVLYTVPQAFWMILLQFHAKEIAAASVISIVWNFWDHSNIVVDIGWLDRLFVTPAFHRLHHAADRRMRTNLGLIFTVWDRLFGTYTDPRTAGVDFPLGLPVRPGASRTPRMVVGL